MAKGRKLPAPLRLVLNRIWLLRTRALAREQAAGPSANEGGRQEGAGDEASLEQRAFELIVGLVPEITRYKKETLKHVRTVAEKRGYDSLQAYHEALAKSEDEVAFLRENLTLKGTHFFRGDDWDYLNEHCLSTFAGKDEVRVWCAGCSSGEEAFSAIMSLLDHVPLGTISVLATDYNRELLDKCRAGAYFRMHRPEIPDRYQRYVVEIEGGKRFTFPQEMKDVMEVRALNLLTDEYPGPFDLVICRNVIKFFAREEIARVQRGLAASVAPGGYLFLSTDGNSKGIELIQDPEAMGMRVVSLRGIYQRVG